MCYQICRALASWALQFETSSVWYERLAGSQIEECNNFVQKTLQTKNAEDYAGDASSTVEMQNLRQALHDHRAQLAEKTNQIDSYKQVGEYLELLVHNPRQKILKTLETYCIRNIFPFNLPIISAYLITNLVFLLNKNSGVISLMQDLGKLLRLLIFLSIVTQTTHSYLCQKMLQVVMQIRIHDLKFFLKPNCAKIQVLRNTAEKLEGSVSDESSEKLTNAFEIAGSLRKLLQERDRQFASLENTCQVRFARPQASSS